MLGIFVPSGPIPKQEKSTVFCALSYMPVIVFFLFASWKIQAYSQQNLSAVT